MKQGALSDYFTGVGAKVLKATEVSREISHGHEFQGVDDFRVFLGTPSEKAHQQVTYIWLSDDASPLTLSSAGTWYDSRKGKSKRTAEYRLYYPVAAEEVVYRAKPGDTLFLCLPKVGPLLAILCAQQTSIEQQLLWLFGLQLVADHEITQVDLREKGDRSLDLTSRYILELMGVEVIATEDQLLDKIVKAFGETFPTTRLFSAFARKNMPGIDGRDNPDAALVAWMDFEERLFMTFERYLVGKRLASGFMKSKEPDVDGFVKYSLSVQNRRKSRAGWAFANHIEEILKQHDIIYVREATTEKRAGPDFLFPGQNEYHRANWPSEKLTMLGVKTSCKDRWRQVLSEADRIGTKHLLTLEPSISVAQTDEMLKEKLQLVLPAVLHETYLQQQRKQLLNVTDFLRLVSSRQTAH